MQFRIQIHRNKPKYPGLVFSSLIFITNVLTAYYKRDYIYSSLFFSLTVTSILFHSKPNLYLNIIDKISIFSIFLYGSYQLSQKISQPITIGNTIGYSGQILLIVATFLATIYLYIYGYWFQKYYFHENPQIGDQYHSLVHLIGSIGHHLILFL